MFQTPLALNYSPEILQTSIHRLCSPTFSCAAVPCICVAKLLSPPKLRRWLREGEGCLAAGVGFLRFANLVKTSGEALLGGFIYCCGRCRKCACLRGRGSAPPCYLKHSIIWRPCARSILTPSWQILPNFIKASAVGLHSCRRCRDKIWSIKNGTYYITITGVVQ